MGWRNQGEFAKLRGTAVFFRRKRHISGETTLANDVAFVFIKDQYQDESVPDWAMKLILDKEDVTDHEH